MSQPVLIKVYGDFWPAPANILEQLASILSGCMPEPEFFPAQLNAGLLTLAFEGIYFPIDDFLGTLAKYITVQSRGKVDALDLENWRLVRYIFNNGKIEERCAPLNNVLDFSGH